MNTRFSDIHQAMPTMSLWSSFYHAGTAWMYTYEFLKGQPVGAASDFMIVDPFIANLVMELNVKAMAAFHDPLFNPRKYSHNTVKILKDYATKIILFQEIVNDDSLIMIIREYQKTVDSRYGTIGGMIPSDEQRRLVDTAYRIRRAMSALTGLR